MKAGATAPPLLPSTGRPPQTRLLTQRPFPLPAARCPLLRPHPSAPTPAGNQTQTRGVRPPGGREADHRRREARAGSQLTQCGRARRGCRRAGVPAGSSGTRGSSRGRGGGGQGEGWERAESHGPRQGAAGSSLGSRRGCFGQSSRKPGLAGHPASAPACSGAPARGQRTGGQGPGGTGQERPDPELRGLWAHGDDTTERRVTQESLSPPGGDGRGEGRGRDGGGGETGDQLCSQRPRAPRGQICVRTRVLPVKTPRCPDSHRPTAGSERNKTWPILGT